MNMKVWERGFEKIDTQNKPDIAKRWCWAFCCYNFLKKCKKIENSLCGLDFNYISFLSYSDKGKALFKGFVCKLKF